jgi:hypothetical protein
MWYRCSAGVSSSIFPLLSVRVVIFVIFLLELRGGKGGIETRKMEVGTKEDEDGSVVLETKSGGREMIHGGSRDGHEETTSRNVIV